MDEQVSLAADIGRRTASTLAAYGAERERAIASARHEFLSAVPSARPEPRTLWYAVSFAALAACLALVGGWLFLRTPRPLAFSTDGKPGSTEAWIAAPVERAVALTFSDGTKLRLEQASRARVISLEPHGASVALENGSLEADVVHTGQSAWRVIAGPVTVKVTGTRFDVKWSAVDEEFTLVVRQGSVVVTGPVLSGDQAVRAGQSLRVSVRARRVELDNGDLSRLPAPRDAASLLVPEAELPIAPQLSPSAGPRAPAEAAPDWRVLARQGSLRQAFSAAEEAGFDAVCRSSSAAELLELADGARLSSRADRATQALTTLRNRFPSDPRRAAAAFALGKVAFELSRNYAQAAQWFSASVREQPQGSLAREASGRLIEALQKSGDAPGARRAAESYLARYPNGPHADLARSVIR